LYAKTRIRHKEDDDILETYLSLRGKILRSGRREILRRKCESSRLIEPAVKGSTWLILEKYFTAYNNFSCSSSTNIFRWKYEAKEREKEGKKQDCKM